MESISPSHALAGGTTRRARVVRRVAAGMALSIGLATTLMAADVWESKPFHTWTDKELTKVLTDSPWAGKGAISYVQNRAGQAPVRETAVVTWASAPVMRQALVREEFGVTATVPAEAAAALASTPRQYIVTVKVTGTSTSADRALYTSEMQDETFLVLRGQPPIPALQASGEVLDSAGRPANAPTSGRETSGGPAFAATPAQRGGGGGGSGAGGGGARGGAGAGAARGTPPMPGSRGRGNVGEPPPATAALLTFRFPRDPITLADKEVEFVTKLCRGGSASGASAPPAANPVQPQLGFAASAQRGGRGDFPQGRGEGPGVRMGDPPPPCNYYVKRTFKLKDMVVQGELAL